MGAEGVARRAFVEADLEFHLTVAAMAANPFLRSISTLIEVALVESLTRSSPLDDPSDAARVVAEHRAIADAIGRRDAAAARATMRVVILEGIRRAATPRT
jgi:DNA-binding FadR family transcriptional regulator